MHANKHLVDENDQQFIINKHIAVLLL